MANLQKYFQEIVTCTATLKFRVQIIQKVGSSTEIKVRLKASSKIKGVSDRLNQHLIHTAPQTSLIKTYLRGCCTLLQLSPPAPRPLLKF